MQTGKNIVIIILAGGSGSRYGLNKLLEELAGLPVIAHSIKNFRGVCPDSRIVVTCPESLIFTYKEIINSSLGSNEFSFTSGGETRAHSVLNALHFLKQFNPEYCAIHDAARPLADAELLLNCLNQCIDKGSAVSARKVTDTIKNAGQDMKIISTVDRSLLWAMETPQVFRFDEILAAYEYVLSTKIQVTDDAGAMETFGKDVFLFENNKPNIKITFSGDIAVAANILNRAKTDC